MISPLRFLAVHPHGEVVEAGALGQRENIGGFQRPIGVIAESLFDVRDGDLILNGDGHLVVEHRQGRDVFVVGNEQPAGVSGSHPGQQQSRDREKAAHWSILS